MSEAVSNIGRLQELLPSLNRFIQNYSIYIYLIDTHHNLLWYNNYTGNKFQFTRKSIKKKCHAMFWRFSQPCGDCPIITEKGQPVTNRQIIHRRFNGAVEDNYIELISLPVFSTTAEIEGFLIIGFDVTAIEKKQQDLREKEKIFISIINNSADAIFMLNNQNEIMSWNRGAADIFGYTPEEILGESIVSLFPKELMELGEVHYIQKELETRGFIRNYETRMLHRNGRLIHVDLISTSLKNENGEFIGYSMMAKDISARKELELELRRTIQELSKLNELSEILYTTYALDDILRIILIAVTAGEGLKFNRAFLLLKDAESNALKGHMAIGPANEAEAHRIWMSLQEKVRSLRDIVQEYEVNLQGTDREINEVVRQMVIPLDRTDHLLVQALHQRQSFQVIKGTINQFETFDLKVDGRDLIQILGYSTFVVVPLYTKEEPLGIIIADNKFTGRDILPDEMESLKFFAGQASMAIENAMLYDRLEDRIQELQEAYQKLENSSDRLLKAERLAAIGKMAASVAHEIRNPLVSIGGFTRLLQKKLPDRSDFHKYTSVIISQVDNLEYILNNILNVASPHQPAFHAFDIHRVIQQLMTVMEESIQKRKVKVELQLGCTDSQVFGDEKLIFQALLNVVKNAIEALVREKELKIVTSCDHKYLCVEVLDSGKGIPKDSLDKIYDPFFTTKSDGTGLGLALVRQIIEEHHGKIEISSSPGTGTQVKMFIPRSHPP